MLRGECRIPLKSASPVFLIRNPLITMLSILALFQFLYHILYYILDPTAGVIVCPYRRELEVGGNLFTNALSILAFSSYYIFIILSEKLKSRDEQPTRVIRSYPIIESKKNRLC